MDRDSILMEIRRIAEANDGVPPGRARFERETGIKESHWSGRYWARWSDALVEAGFVPNVMQGPYSQEELLRSLARIIDELGKWPTTAELKLYARKHPGFPSHNTIRRLGSRADQARLLIERQNQLALSSDVLAICHRVLAEVRPSRRDGNATQLIARGYVYLLKSGRYYKIGHSNDPGRRAYEVRLQMPERVTVVHQIETDDPQGIEAYWHRRFADKRRNGEWFVLDRADISAFRSRKSM